MAVDPAARWRLVPWSRLKVMLPEIPPPPKKRRPPRLREKRTELTVEQILAWADAHHQRTGRWPTKTTGPVAETLKKTWLGGDSALRAGGPGFPGARPLASACRPRRCVAT